MAVRFVKFTEAMRPVIAIVKERRPVDEDRRIKTPTEIAVVNPISGKERPDAEPGSPIPSWPDPTRTIPSGPYSNVDMGRIDRSFREI